MGGRQSWMLGVCLLVSSLSGAYAGFPSASSAHAAVLFSVAGGIPVSGVLLHCAVGESPPPKALAVNADAKVHSAPEETAPIIALLKDGRTHYYLLGAHVSWYKIAVKDTIGWVSAQQVRPSAPRKPAQKSAIEPDSDAPAVTVSAKYARVRSAPNETASFVVLLKNGERYTLLDRHIAWYKIAIQDTIGWISAKEVRPYTPKPNIGRSQRRKSATKAKNQPKASSQRARAESESSDDTHDSIPPAETIRTAAPSNSRGTRTSSPSREPTTAARKKAWQAPVLLIKPVNDRAAQKTAPPKSTAKQRYAQVLKGTLRVLKEVSPDSPILGMINKGTTHPIVALGDSWVLIEYKDRTGWVERRYIEVVEKPSLMVVMRDFLFIVAALIAIALTALIIKLIMGRRDKLQKAWLKTVSVQKNLLVVAGDEKYVERYLTNTSTTLEECFSEVGFKVTRARAGNEVLKLLVHYRPDVIAIDWNIDPNVHPWTARVLGSRPEIKNVFTLFYNVPDPSSVNAAGKIPKVEYLGPQFTDREIFAIVTPRLIAVEAPKTISKSVESSALEGSVGQGNLAEVFQFVEIGHKTGALLVECHEPFGIIYFGKGAIVYAATKNATAEKAVFEMLGLSEGRFRFVLDHKPKNTNCMIPTLGILMEWTRLVDEASRH
ncbi:MAG: SH3 domain-containing protein [Chitinivibrionales bacterium]|nr:SH3 domain-containing protein [Chitinivibrionales bacterium]MBD3357337.1 SH3 domain-containing protein [Chitinivibrionales bacterium]